jgi:hypothetical protein
MVSFRSGGTYLYFNVPDDVYSQLINYYGPGNYFNEYIRDAFPSRLIGGEDEFMSVINPDDLQSTGVYEENPELERGADWIISAQEEGTPEEVIDQVRNNMGLSDLKLQQLLNRRRRSSQFSI